MNVDSDDGHNNVQYEYMLPNTHAAKIPKQAEYIFIYQAWGKCSKTCANGMLYQRHIF